MVSQNLAPTVLQLFALVEHFVAEPRLGVSQAGLIGASFQQQFGPAEQGMQVAAPLYLEVLGGSILGGLQILHGDYLGRIVADCLKVRRLEQHLRRIAPKVNGGRPSLGCEQRHAVTKSMSCGGPELKDAIMMATVK